jgi:hypothetical protein
MQGAEFQKQAFAAVGSASSLERVLPGVPAEATVLITSTSLF